VGFNRASLSRTKPSTLSPNLSRRLKLLNLNLIPARTNLVNRRMTVRNAGDVATLNGVRHARSIAQPHTSRKQVEQDLLFASAGTQGTEHRRNQEQNNTNNRQPQKRLKRKSYNNTHGPNKQ
jgi:hypothetical protein